MKEHMGWIVGLLAKRAAAVPGSPPLLQGPVGHAGITDRWDEVLLASISDETATKVLEFWGPRRI